jgi:hypothetical protein
MSGVTIVRPPAGNRGSKLVVLGLPVVLVPDPDSFAVRVPVSFSVPVSFAVDEASSSSFFLSPVSVAVGFSDACEACVFFGASEEALSESNRFR